MLLLMNSLQITSCLLLVNIIMPINLYEGLRLFASLIFFDVPAWENESTKSKLFVVPPVDTMARRRLQQSGSPMLTEYRFRRTGFTNLFLADCYMQIMTIAIMYLVILAFICLGRSDRHGSRFRPALKYLYSAQTSLHEIALMYFTLTVMFEFEYFREGAPIRIVSIAICGIICLYYLVYHVHRYHQLLSLPLLDPCCEEYKLLVEKYGSLLKNIRFQEAAAYRKCLPIRAYFQPQLYHVVSYIKKLLMMLAFPFFYDSGSTVLAVLIALQCLEIGRFCLTWPFAKRWRNWMRLALEIILLLVFILVFAIQGASLLIFGSNPPAGTIRAYYDLGWAAFALVLIFNFSYFFLCIFDLVRGYKYSNREMVDSIRRDYYQSKLEELKGKYEDTDEHRELIRESIRECVKKGNLKYPKNLPDVTLKIEEYEIAQKGIREDTTYFVSISNITEAVIGLTSFDRNGDCVEVLRRFEGTWRVDGKKHAACFDIIHSCYTNFAKGGKLIIRTFSHVEQKKYRSGDRINLYLNGMRQEVELEGDPEPKKLDRLLPGFPITEDLLLKLDERLSIQIAAPQFSQPM